MFALPEARNLSSDKSLTHLQILSYGLKFVPSPASTNFDEVEIDLYSFTRRIWNYIAFQYKDGATFDDDFKPVREKFKRSHIWTKSYWYYPPEQCEELLPVAEILNNFFENVSLALKAPTTDKKDKVLYKQAAKLLKRNDVTVRQSDKNLGIVIFDTITYHRLCMKLLNDPAVYTQINSYFQIGTRIHFEEAAKEFISQLNLSKKEKQFLQNTTYDINAVFHGLAKLQKNLPLENLPMRPIIGYKREQILSKLSCIVVERLSGIIVNLKTVLKDSRKVISDLEFCRFPINPNVETFLLTVDYVSLYTSIPLNDLYRVLRDLARLNEEDIQIIKFICDNNYFLFGTEMFKQKDGFAMGTNVAPLLANIYLYYKVDVLIRTRFAYFMRFIDDVFSIYRGNEINLQRVLNEFSQAALPLKITWNIDREKAIFLDLEIHYRDNTISFITYQKPLNIYAYIPEFSSHSWGVFKGFIIGELIRYMRTCSYYEDFNNIRKLFWLRLLARGYKPAMLILLFKNDKCLWTNKHSQINDTIEKPLFALPVRFSHSSRIRSLNREIRSLNEYFPWANISLSYKRSLSVVNLVMRSNLTAAQSTFIAENKFVEFTRERRQVARVQGENENHRLLG